MTAGPIEFGVVEDGAAAPERVEDVDFSDVTLSPAGLPQEQSAQIEHHQPPAVRLPADQRPVPAGVHAVSDLEALFGEMKRDLGLHDVVLPVPLRPGYEARYRLVLDDHELQPWRRESYDPTCLEGVDQGKLARLGLAALNSGILAEGREVRDESGALVTFSSPWMLERLQVRTAAEALRKFYAMDAHVTSTWSALMAESGFGVMLFPVDRVGDDPAAPPDPR